MTETYGVSLAGGYPALRRDIRRNLRRGWRELAADGLEAQVAFVPLAADPELRHEITAAYLARTAAAGRPVSLDGLTGAWETATEAAVLRTGGKLAAWLLAAPAPQAYRVLGGQMVPGFERYRPGRILEAMTLARVMLAGWDRVDWGPGHPESLIAVS